MKIRIRCLSGKNYPCVKVLFRKAFAEETYPIDDLLTSWIQRSVDDSYGFFLGDDMIGFVIASYNPRSGSSLYIDYIALEPEYRGSGIGSFLLDRIVRTCYEKRGSIHLYPERCELLDWYKRHGFHETNKNYYVFHSYSTRTQHAIHKSLGL